MRGTIRRRASRWIVALIWGALLLDGGCIQAPTFPTIGPPAPHGSGSLGGAARRVNPRLDGHPATKPASAGYGTAWFPLSS